MRHQPHIYLTHPRTITKLQTGRQRFGKHRFEFFFNG